MAGFKQINLEVKKRTPVEWDKAGAPTKWKTEIEEYGFNLYDISYWRGQTIIIEEDGKKDRVERKTRLYLKGNPKGMELNIPKEEFEAFLKEQVGDDNNALMHLAEQMVELSKKIDGSN